jgi:hypothetical protein
MRDPDSAGRTIRPAQRTAAVCVAGLALALCGQASGQVPATLNGPPIQVQPYAPEPGVPPLTIAPGTPNPFPDAGDTGTSTGGGTTSAGAGSPLSTMLGTPWGAQATANAQALGVSATALAATCVMESGCASDPGTNGTISGTFQMTDATYQQMIAEAEANNPALAASIPPGLAGKSDPAVEAVAAAEYLYDGAQTLQAAGVADPTFSDERALYQFGISGGEAVALADPSDLISSHLSLTPSQYAANGIDPATTTVGQWRQSVANKVGTAANMSILAE